VKGRGTRERRGRVAVGAWLALAALAGCGSGDAAVSWTLVAADEFNGAQGAPPDPAFWSFDVGGGGFGNGESEYYTSRPDNITQDGAGNLVITARLEDYMGRKYTSARINTRGKHEITYGRMEARMQLPVGKGMWPAFWMLGANLGQVGWPGCGEIDVMESRGAQPALAYGSLHGPGYSGGNALSAVFTAPAGTTLADGMHVYGIEWNPGEIRFSVDGAVYETQRAGRLGAGKQWVFDGHAFFALLNLAVGGRYGGEPDATTPFPQSLVVDYVRFYSRGPAP
jgi:beta-glucanase (GH16 family)